jgi:hypothetical protein
VPAGLDNRSVRELRRDRRDNAAALTNGAVAAADMSIVTAMTDTTVSGIRICLTIFIPFLS